MAGSDFPHTEGTTTPAAFMRDQKRALSASDTSKVMYENGRSVLAVRG